MRSYNDPLAGYSPDVYCEKLFSEIGGSVDGTSSLFGESKLYEDSSSNSSDEASSEFYDSLLELLEED